MDPSGRGERPKTIDDLPDEILEYILSLVSPYGDSERCRVVCRRWARAIRSVNLRTKSELYRAIVNASIVWNHILAPSSGPITTVTKRYSHAACIYDNLMYVFGGCTLRCTMFNDLWTLDLTSRKWIRPYSTGCYPSPKACATVCCYNDNLILFGGWTHPPPYPLHQIQRLFNELHIYEIASNTWSVVHSSSGPPPMAGHSATVHGNKMIVFGGLQWGGSLFLYSSSNEVWCLDLDTLSWSKPQTTETKPDTRYGQSQIYLDNNNLLIMGGCQGPNAILDDVWVLDMSESVWVWKQLTVNNTEWAAPHLWCHPGCRVDDVVVVFSSGIPQTLSPYTPCPLRTSPPPHPSHDINIPQEVLARREPPVPPPYDKDVNVNGQRGSFGRKVNQADEPDEPRPSTSSGSTGQNPPHFPLRVRINDLNGDPQPHCSGRGNRENGELQLAAFRNEPSTSSNSRNRAKQLESLKKMEEKYKVPNKEDKPKPEESDDDDPIDPVDPNDPDDPDDSDSSDSISPSKMMMYVMDISKALTEDGSVAWRPPKPHRRAPRDTVFHSLLLGRGEMIIFGGVQKNSSAASVPVASYKSVSNTTHIISPARRVV